jgi:aminobenzoyl-glutamate transport protein
MEKMARSHNPLLHRWLDFAERTGNRLPHPVTLFALASAAVLLLSWLLAQFGVGAAHPSTGKTVTVANLLSPDGVRRVITSLVTNFTGFAPLGTVVVAMLGVAAADGWGLLVGAAGGLGPARNSDGTGSGAVRANAVIY